MEELEALNEVIAKRANQRFKELEKNDFETAAYNYAKYYLQNESERSGGETFSRKKITSEDDMNNMAADLKQAARFLRSQTSTVSGEKKRRERIYHSLTTETIDKDGNVVKQAALKIPKSITVPEDYSGSKEDYFKKRFLSFLDEDVWKDVKKYVYAEDTQVLNEAGEAIARGAQVQDLIDAFEEWDAGHIKTDPVDIWDDWITVNKKTETTSN